MLHPEINNRDVMGFAIHNVDRMLPNAMKDIMSDPKRFLAVFRLFEYYNFPKDVRSAQLRIMESMCKKMNQERAQDAIMEDCLLRVVRAYKFHHPSFRNTLVNFLYAVIDKAGSENLDLPKLINLTLCEYPAVQECGMKAICMMSVPEEIDKFGLRYEKDRIDVAFHVHIPYLIDCGKSITHSTDFKNYALQALANLCQRAYLKPYVLYNDGIGCFLDALKNEHNLAGRRIAAKALAQLVEGDEKLRVRIVTSLSEEVKQTWMHEVDSVIGVYIRRILRSDT